ncbi:MAG: hypothetical protein HYR64_07595 [Fimbriimonas ginsengisoli]|uniref:Uncharacterized protein n=1 Tax=Fimbriimonas ginsengisoli TaxID=1005039 RepID=A0A931LWH3_FIMGI|nr:hypothetical protein [Fimbriimonas ginsengisoli]
MRSRKRGWWTVATIAVVVAATAALSPLLPIPYWGLDSEPSQRLRALAAYGVCGGCGLYAPSKATMSHTLCDRVTGEVLRANDAQLQAIDAELIAAGYKVQRNEQRTAYSKSTGGWFPVHLFVGFGKDRRVIAGKSASKYPQF